MDVRYAYEGDPMAKDYVAQCLAPLGCVCTERLEEASVVFTHCLHNQALEDAYFEDEGLIKRAAPGTLLVDLSASTPSLARELSAVAAVNDLPFVEAPLAVDDPFSPEAWRNPKAMTCFLSGEADDCQAVLPFARALANTVHQVGNYGAAQLARAMRTTLQAARIVSVIEANALFGALEERGWEEGPDPLFDVPFGEDFTQAQKLLAADDFDGPYTVALFMSDVAAAMAAADDGELILPHLESVMHILELIGVIGGASRGIAVLALLYRDEAEGVAFGLDWNRAESLYGPMPGGSESLSDDFDEGMSDGRDFLGGFGGYSAN